MRKKQTEKNSKRKVVQKKALKKILIVEDDRSLKMALSEKFKHEGFEVFQESNGKEGLESALENKPDLILLDLLMPIMDGMTMLKKLRKDKWGATVYVIILTNKEPDIRLSDEAERVPYMSSYLMKSDFDISDIVKMTKKRI
jgi:CheY-like chemotaxis protein